MNGADLHDAYMREAVIEAAYIEMTEARERYARLQIIDACFRIRGHHPTAGLVKLTLGEDGIHGWGAALHAIYDRAGQLLWTISDDNGGVEDDSSITDALARARTWDEGAFVQSDDDPWLFDLDVCAQVDPPPQGVR